MILQEGFYTTKGIYLYKTSQVLEQSRTHVDIEYITYREK